MGIATAVALVVALGVAFWRLAAMGALGEVARFAPFALGGLALLVGGVLLVSLGQARWMARLPRRGTRAPTAANQANGSDG
ncbi:MAG: hypothetical protein ACM3ZA_01135 [Bacillota bacterium]